MRKNFETFKHNLEEEHNKLSDDLRKIENRHRIINRNKLERRLECILEFSIIPFILSNCEENKFFECVLWKYVIANLCTSSWICVNNLNKLLVLFISIISPLYNKLLVL